MNTENELKAIRYLLNDLILYVYDLRVKLDEIKPSANKYRTREPNVGGDTIGFDLFNISKKQYNSLIDKYGIDIVNRSCVALDEFIKINEYLPYGNAYRAIDKKFTKEIKEENNELQKDIEQ